MSAVPFPLCSLFLHIKLRLLGQASLKGLKLFLNNLLPIDYFFFPANIDKWIARDPDLGWQFVAWMS